MRQNLRSAKSICKLAMAARELAMARLNLYVHLNTKYIIANCIQGTSPQASLS